MEPGRRVGQRVDQRRHVGLPAGVDRRCAPSSPGTRRSRRPRGSRTGPRRRGRSSSWAPRPRAGRRASPARRPRAGAGTRPPRPGRRRIRESDAFHRAPPESSGPGGVASGAGVPGRAGVRRIGLEVELSTFVESNRNAGPRITTLSLPIVYGWPPLRLGTVKVSPSLPVISPLTSLSATTYGEVAEVRDAPQAEDRGGAVLDERLHVVAGSRDRSP